MAHHERIRASRCRRIDNEKIRFDSLLSISRSVWMEAIVASWLILSPFGAVAVVTPFIVPFEVLGKAIPPCPRQLALGKPCLLCGMTHAFYRVAAGEFLEAQRFNRGALGVFGLLAVNSCGFALTAGRHLRRKISSKSKED